MKPLPTLFLTLPREIQDMILDLCNFTELFILLSNSVKMMNGVIRGHANYFVHAEMFRCGSSSFWKKELPDRSLVQHPPQVFTALRYSSDFFIRFQSDVTSLVKSINIRRETNGDNMPRSFGIVIDHSHMFNRRIRPILPKSREVLAEMREDTDYTYTENHNDYIDRFFEIIRAPDISVEHIMIHASMCDRISFDGKNVTRDEYRSHSCSPDYCDDDSHAIRESPALHNNVDSRVLEEIRNCRNLRTLLASFHNAYGETEDRRALFGNIFTIRDDDPVARCRLKTLCLASALKPCDKQFERIDIMDTWADPDRFSQAFFRMISKAVNIDLEQYCKVSLLTFMYILRMIGNRIKYFTMDCVAYAIPPEVHPRCLTLSRLEYLSFSRNNTDSEQYIKIICPSLRMLKVGYSSNLRIIANAPNLRDLCIMDKNLKVDTFLLEFFSHTRIENLYIDELKEVTDYEHLFNRRYLPFLEELVIRSDLSLSRNVRCRDQNQYVQDNLGVDKVARFFRELDDNIPPTTYRSNALRRIGNLLWITSNVPDHVTVDEARENEIRIDMNLFVESFCWWICPASSHGLHGCDKCDKRKFGQFRQLSLPEASLRLLEGGIWSDGTF